MPFERKTLEKETPEFQRLSSARKENRRIFLEAGLGIILDNSKDRKIDKQTGFAAGRLLEFYLTGQIDSEPYKPHATSKLKRKPK
jgi:hypothetical protein